MPREGDPPSPGAGLTGSSVGMGRIDAFVFAFGGGIGLAQNNKVVRIAQRDIALEIRREPHDAFEEGLRHPNERPDEGAGSPSPYVRGARRCDHFPGIT